MRVSWRSHWQLRSTFCPFEAFYEMLKKKYEFADYQCGPTSGGWCTSWYIRSAHLSPTVRNPHSAKWTRKPFLSHRLKKKKFHTSACIQLSGIILCVLRLRHIWKPGQQSSDLKCVLFSSPSSSEEKVLCLSRYPTLCIKIAQIEKPGQQSNVYLV